ELEFEVAAVTTGEFWRLLGPVSPSPASFAVTPSLPRSIASPVFSKIALPLTVVFVALPVTATPAPPFDEIVLDPPGVVPPIVTVWLLHEGPQQQRPARSSAH